MNEFFKLTKKQFHSLVVAGDNCLDGWDYIVLEKDRDDNIEVVMYKDFKHTEELKRIRL